MARKYVLTQKCALIKEWFIASPISTAYPPFKPLPVRDRNVADCYLDPLHGYYPRGIPHRLRAHEDSGSLERADSKISDGSSRLQSLLRQMYAHGMAWHGAELSTEKLLQPSLDNIQQ